MNAQQTFRLAVVDDDSGFITVLAKRAERMNWGLRQAAAGIPPEELVAMKLDGLLADPSALGEGAWDYLEHVRARLSDLGVIVCTERSTVAQRVRGLRMGVDDWITKPCHPEEVMVRLEAITRRGRRARSGPDSGLLISGELEIQPHRFQALVGGAALDLTRREYELLQLLAEAKGQVLEREVIYQRVWGYAMAHGDRSVDVFVRKLRQKLERRSPCWRYIHTHFGIGYRFDPVLAPDAEARASASGRASAKEPAHESQPLTVS